MSGEAGAEEETAAGRATWECREAAGWKSDCVSRKEKQ